MDKTDFYKNGFMAAAERMICAEAECRQFLLKVMKEKAVYVKNRIKEYTYGKDDLLEQKDYYGKYYREGTYKAVLVEAEVSHGMMQGIVDTESYYSGRVASLTVLFMQDPNELLDDKKLKMTDGEKRILKRFKKTYDRGCMISGGNDIEEIKVAGHDLWCLKNELRVVHECTWTYSFDRIMSEGFIENGLKAAKTII